MRESRWPHAPACCAHPAVCVSPPASPTAAPAPQPPTRRDGICPPAERLHRLAALVVPDLHRRPACGKLLPPPVVVHRAEGVPARGGGRRVGAGGYQEAGQRGLAKGASGARHEAGRRRRPLQSCCIVLQARRLLGRRAAMGTVTRRGSCKPQARMPTTRRRHGHSLPRKLEHRVRILNDGSSLKGRKWHLQHSRRHHVEARQRRPRGPAALRRPPLPQIKQRPQHGGTGAATRAWARPKQPGAPNPRPTQHPRVPLRHRWSVRSRGGAACPGPPAGSPRSPSTA